MILNIESVFEDPGSGWSHFATAESSVSICSALGNECPLIGAVLYEELYRNFIRRATATGVQNVRRNGHLVKEGAL